jgi:hypothetical protein
MARSLRSRGGRSKRRSARTPPNLVRLFGFEAPKPSVGPCNHGAGGCGAPCGAGAGPIYGSQPRGAGSKVAKRRSVHRPFNGQAIVCDLFAADGGNA